jgi:cytochrome P450 enzyme
MDAPIPADFVFEPNSQRFSADPHPDYAWLRANAPIYHWRERGALVLSRMAETRAFFQDPHLSLDIRDWEHYPGSDMFSHPRYAAWGRILRSGLFQLAPEDHARVRKLASVALTPRAVGQMQRAVRAAVDASLAQLIAGTDADARGELGVANIREFAEPIPLKVVCDLLGVPSHYRGGFRRFGIAMIESVQPSRGTEAMEGIADTVTEGVALLDDMIRELRSLPTSLRPPNLLTDWINANEDDQRLTDDELLGLVGALIIAGSDTTVHGTCYAVHALLSHPEALRELQADRSLLRGAIEESLRWDSFGKLGLMRYATRDFVFCGTPVRKGQLVTALIGAAGRDSEAYVDADRFDIHRDHLINLNFGLGRHFCLGVNLARSELMTAVETLLIDRFPEAELAGDVVVDPRNSVMRAMTQLPVRLGRDHGRGIDQREGPT